MRIGIKAMWSPDVDPPSSGLPANPSECDMLLQVCLVANGVRGEPVYSARVCSPELLAQVPSGKFVVNTLAMREFSWTSVKERIEKLLRHCESCKSWDEVDHVLAGYLKSNDIPGPEV